MQIVIELPDDENGWSVGEVERALQNGIILPEGHGDLIDRGKLGFTDSEINMCGGSYAEYLGMLIEKIEEAKVVIPAVDGDEERA